MLYNSKKDYFQVHYSLHQAVHHEQLFCGEESDDCQLSLESHRDLLAEEVKDKHNEGTTYDLIANVVHDGSPETGNYRVHILHAGSGKWFEMNDLYMTEILPQMITLTEAYIQIYKRREEPKKDQ